MKNYDHFTFQTPKEAAEMSEAYLLALMLYREARGVSLQTRAAAYKAIGMVALNRTADSKKRWPKNIGQVVLQAKQFSSFNPDDPNASVFCLPQLHLSEQFAWAQALDVAEDILKSVPNQIAYGNHYHSAPKDPHWAKGKTPIMTLGPFKFYLL